MKLKKGVNLLRLLSEGSCGRDVFDIYSVCDEIRRISYQGFDHVRAVIECDILDLEALELKDSVTYMLDRLVSCCSTYGMNVIIGFYGFMSYPDASALEKFSFSNKHLNLPTLIAWDRLARRYGKCDNVAFELLNKVINPMLSDIWNDCILETVSVIRNITAQTPVIYGGIQYNSIDNLPLLDKPLFDNIYFSFHYYETLIFEDQEAYWVKNMGLKEHEELIKKGIAYADKLNIPLYCGELGVCDNEEQGWSENMERLLEKYDIGFSVWDSFIKCGRKMQVYMA